MANKSSVGFRMAVRRPISWAHIGRLRVKAFANLVKVWGGLASGARGQTVWLGLCNAILTDLVQQRLVADLQQGRRLFAIPVGFF